MLNVNVYIRVSVCYDKGTDSLLVLGKGSTSLYEGVVEQYSLATGAFMARVVHDLDDTSSHDLCW